mgnify:CR=1 FL=1
MTWAAPALPAVQASPRKYDIKALPFKLESCSFIRAW